MLPKHTTKSLHKPKPKRPQQHRNEHRPATASPITIFPPPPPTPPPLLPHIPPPNPTHRGWLYHHRPRVLPLLCPLILYILSPGDCFDYWTGGNSGTTCSYWGLADLLLDGVLDCGAAWDVGDYLAAAEDGPGAAEGGVVGGD